MSIVQDNKMFCTLYLTGTGASNIGNDELAEVKPKAILLYK